MGHMAHRLEATVVHVPVVATHRCAAGCGQPEATCPPPLVLQASMPRSQPGVLYPGGCCTAYQTQQQPGQVACLWLEAQNICGLKPKMLWPETQNVACFEHHASVTVGRIWSLHTRVCVQFWHRLRVLIHASSSLSLPFHWKLSNVLSRVLPKSRSSQGRRVVPGIYGATATATAAGPLSQSSARERRNEGRVDAGGRAGRSSGQTTLRVSYTAALPLEAGLAEQQGVKKEAERDPGPDPAGEASTEGGWVWG
eukprot:362977-Chlamydomonas_euryale.AAC.4